MEKKIIEKFGNKLRVRVCGILIENQKILLVKHRSIVENGVLWAALIREFEEETGLKVKVEKYLFTHEFLKPPLHAIELFFKVSRLEGEVKRGYDPEMDTDEQIITDVAFLEINQLMKIENDSLHNVLRMIDKLNDLLYLEGYVKFEDFT
jgi:8-oxo-dGTP diphosphatase